jgi:DNA polymerase-4
MLVAKVASDADKPDGFTVLSREMACERFAGAAPGLIPGIGPKTAARLEREGITTLGALAATSDERLAELFGSRLGPHLRRLACFEDERPIELERRAKSESRETTFDTDIEGVAELEPILDRLAAELCKTLVKQDSRGRTIGIKVRLDDFSTHTRARTRPEPTNDVDVVRAVATDLLRAFDPQRPVRLLGVRVAGLDEADDQLRAGQLELSL